MRNHGCRGVFNECGEVKKVGFTKTFSVYDRKVDKKGGGRRRRILYLKAESANVMQVSGQLPPQGCSGIMSRPPCYNSTIVGFDNKIPHAKS